MPNATIAQTGSFYERHRPRRLEDVCGHQRSLKRLLTLDKTVGLQGQALWITGESGAGKTTIARIIAADVADPLLTYEVDAQDVSLDKLREWEKMSQFKPLFGGGYCFIINEAHGLSSKAVSRFQTLLEDENTQRNSTYIFTTTNKGEKLLFDTKMDACPFLSRVVSIKLELDSKTGLAMAERLQSIAQAEQLDGQPIRAYIELLADCKFNMRQALQRIATGEMME